MNQVRVNTFDVTEGAGVYRFTDPAENGNEVIIKSLRDMRVASIPVELKDEELLLEAMRKGIIPRPFVERVEASKKKFERKVKIGKTPLVYKPLVSLYKAADVIFGQTWQMTRTYHPMPAVCYQLGAPVLGFGQMLKISTDDSTIQELCWENAYVMVNQENKRIFYEYRQIDPDLEIIIRWKTPPCAQEKKAAGAAISGMDANRKAQPESNGEGEHNQKKALLQQQGLLM